MARTSTVVLSMLAFLAAASCGGGGGSSAPSLAEQLQLALPPVNGLPTPFAPPRHVSARSFELLDDAPVAQSANGVTYTQGSIVLDPSTASDGFAWAIFALSGFPTDRSIYPTDCSVTANAACWIGCSNFETSVWDFYPPSGDGGHPLANGAQLISLTGVHYVAVIATGEPTPIAIATHVEVDTSAELPTAPTVVLNLPIPIVQSFSAEFTALGSTAGTGVIEGITYDWGDGTTDDVVDPAQIVRHTYASAGPKTVRLTVRNDRSLSDTAERPITVAPAMRELLLVYNADVPADLDLANYYASAVTGRAVDPAYVLGIHPVVASKPEEITRANYASTIRDPIKAYIDAGGFKDTLKYVLLCKGVPHKIQGVDQSDMSRSTFSSVDSELCLLYADGTYPYEGWVWNGANFNTLDGSGFFLSSDTAFVPHASSVSTATQTFALDYLVGRLTAYTYADVKAIIDRAIDADRSGTGSIVFDSSNVDISTPPVPQHTYDTMVDPVWNWTTADAQKSGYELLNEAGFAVFADDTSLAITGLASDGITVPIDRLIGYAGWGRNHAGGPFPSSAYYILRDLKFTYLPGACFMSYESYNADTFSCSNPNDLTIGHPGQGQIADFLHMGGTVAIGNCWEPWIVGVGDERWVFDRYIHHGDRWIEAAYKGLRLLSWQEVVVGDPLCRVR